MPLKLKCECGACRTCKAREYRRIWRAQNPEYDRARYHQNLDKERNRSLAYYHDGNGKLRRRQRDGIIDAHLVEEVLAEQGGVCGICHTSDPGRNGWQADHDHKTGLLRGVLCNTCNPGLGYFKDCTKRLFSAIKYLLFPPAQRVRDRQK